MDLFDLTLHELHAKLKSKEVSSREATSAMLDRIAELEPRINAFITVTPERAAEPVGPLFGGAR